MAVPDALNVTLYMDFMADRLDDDRAFRLLTVLDDFDREELGIKVDFSLPAKRVIRSLNRIVERRGKPCTIRMDNGPEYITETLRLMPKHHSVASQAKPTRIATEERMCRTLQPDGSAWVVGSIHHRRHKASEI